MQYKIPIHVENEDIVVAGLSVRQLIILMVWGGLAYVVFKEVEPRLGGGFALAFAGPLVLIGVVIALTRVAEMTFLPLILNYIRLVLNAKTRLWSIGTDGFSDLEVGYITVQDGKKDIPANLSIDEQIDDDFANKLNKLS